MANEASEAREVLNALEPVIVAGAGAAHPAAAPLAGAVLEAIRRVIQEADIAHAQGEVLTGDELLRRSTERLAKAAADPGLPAEARAP